MKLIVWICERTIEILFASLLLIWFAGPPSAFVEKTFAEQFIRMTNAAIFFNLASGYIVGSFIVGYIHRSSNVVVQAVRMTLTYSVHVGILNMFSGSTFLSSDVVVLFALGIPAVILANGIGASFLKKA